MYIYTSKNLSANLTTLSNEYRYIVNSQNGIIYFSTEKGISIEFAIDKLISSQIKGVFVYEDLENNHISLIFINDIAESISFDIRLDFSMKKIENFIKLVCFQKSIDTVYFLENSKVEKNIEIPSFINKQFIERAVLKKALKKAPAIKNRQNKLMSLGTFLIVVIVFELLLGKSFDYLITKTNNDFNKNYEIAEKKKIFLLEELSKYEGLSQNLRDIKIVKTLDEYNKIKSSHSLSDGEIQ